MSISKSYFESRRQLIEGPGDAHSGAWPVSWFRIAKGWGLLPEEAWPDQGDYSGIVPNEPKDADDNAKRLRLSHYQRLRTSLECLYTISIGKPVIVALEIGKEWAKANRGQIPDILASPGNVVHQIGIASFDFESETFSFANSWGPGWGYRSYGRFSPQHLQRYFVDAWTMTYSSQHSPSQPGIQRTTTNGEPSSLGWPLLLELYDNDKDVVLGWAFALHRPTVLDVEELFIRPEYRGQGFGKTLANDLLRMAEERFITPRFWIPWGDHAEHNATQLHRWLSAANLSVELSGVRWAAYKATPGTPAEQLPALPWIPKKATGPLSALLDSPEQSAISESEWTEEMSDRRAQLIEKKYRIALSHDEQEELAELQEEFGKYQDRIAPLPPT